jgi:hypothetical protein
LQTIFLSVKRVFKTGIPARAEDAGADIAESGLERLVTRFVFATIAREFSQPTPDLSQQRANSRQFFQTTRIIRRVAGSLPPQATQKSPCFFVEPL